MPARKILVAFDGSDAAYRALEQAIESAQALDAQIDVVTVLRPDIAAVRPAAYLLIDRGFDPGVHTPTGDPATQIARLASDGGHDVVYLGTRGRGSLVRAPEGSVSGAVAEPGGTTVVIAR